jgi:hypothetical protein
MTQKLYCYVDETGQDTEGGLFVVAVAIIGTNREEVRKLLQQIEYTSGKGKKKWMKATRKQRHAYIKQVVQALAFRGRIFFASFEKTTDYLPCLLQTVAWALARATFEAPYQATILIDGLGKKEYHRVGTGLRDLGVVVKKVRGLRDENDEFVRLVDATAGFVRDHLEGQVYGKELYQEAVRVGTIEEVKAIKNPRG